jgi:lysozyme
MKLNEQGYKFIAKHEGLRLKPYLCPAKIPTIGYGNTYYPNGKRVTLLDNPITKEQAFEMFKIIADRFGKRVDDLVTSKINQNQFNALVSFCYNVGTGNFMKSTLLKKVNADPNDFDIRLEFAKWNKAGGVKSNGLVNRRSEESALYYTAN